MTRPIIGFLADFTPVARPADVAHAETAGEAQRREAERIDALLAEAREEGRAAARAEAEAATAALRHELEAGHAENLAAARAAWAAGEGATLGAALRAGLAELEREIADQLGAALLPLLGPALRARALAELRQGVADLVAGGQGAPVSVSGPADLIDALRAGLGEANCVTFTTAERPEVVVEAGDGLIRGQIQAWSARFQSTLGTLS